MPHGLKDHEIVGLINSVRDVLQSKNLTFRNYAPLRALISEGVLDYLEANNLRLDKPESPQ